MPHLKEIRKESRSSLCAVLDERNVAFIVIVTVFPGVNLVELVVAVTSDHALEDSTCVTDPFVNVALPAFLIISVNVADTFPIDDNAFCFCLILVTIVLPVYDSPSTTQRVVEGNKRAGFPVSAVLDVYQVLLPSLEVELDTGSTMSPMSPFTVPLMYSFVESSEYPTETHINITSNTTIKYLVFMVAI